MRPWLYRLCKLTAGTSADAALYGAGRDRTWLPPRLSALGQWIVALLLLLGLLGLGNRAEAQVSISQITSTGADNFNPSINADGTKIAFVSNEVSLYTQGVGITQITSMTGSFFSFYPSINADGSKIAFKSNGNLTGDNPDGNTELFLATVSGTSPPPTTGSLQVTVRRSDTNALLPGASVSLSGGPSSPAPQTTGSNGTAIFSNLEAGNYTVTASLTGFQTGSTTATVSANTTTSAIISLTPTPTTGTLQVTVRRSDTQAALPGALVTAASPGTLQSQTTGSSGTTTFLNLQAGSYSLTVSLSGFQTGSATATVSATTTTSASISLTPTPTTGTWSGWSAVPGGGQTGSQPTAVVDSTGALRLYIQGIDNGLWVKQKSGGIWSDWSRVPGGSLDGPAAFLDGSAVRLVVRGLDNSLWTALADTPTWTHLGGRTERSPAALLHAGLPSIFIRGLDGRLYETLRDQTGVWSQWAEVPSHGLSSGQPAAVVDSTGTLHLYIQGIDNSLWTNQVSPTLAWGQWTAGVGGKSSVGPAAVLDGDKVRLVVRGLDNRIYTTLASDTQATQWSSWENLGGQTLNTPAVIRDGNTLHFFIRGIDGRLYMNSRTGGNGSSDSEHGEE